LREALLTKRTWIAFILLGFAGELSWGVESQFFNSADR